MNDRVALSVHQCATAHQIALDRLALLFPAEFALLRTEELGRLEQAVREARAEVRKARKGKAA